MEQSATHSRGFAGIIIVRVVCTGAEEEVKLRLGGREYLCQVNGRVLELEVVVVVITILLIGVVVLAAAV